MRLLLQTEDRPPYWLVGNPVANDRTDQSSGMSETIQIMRNQQVITGADWESILTADRGNQSITLSAMTRREFASEIERMDFISLLGASEPINQLHRWEGDVVLRVDSADGNTYQDYLLPDSTVSLVACVLVGAVALNLTYQVKAGGFGQRQPGGTTGELFALTATDPGSLYHLVDDAVMNAAITTHLAGSTGVVELGVYSQTATGPLTLYGGTILFFRDAAAYTAYLGADAALYAPLNQGQWRSTGTNFTWSYLVPGTSIWLMGSPGFTLPYTNARRRIAVPSGSSATRLGFMTPFIRDNNVQLLHLNTGGTSFFTSRTWTLRLSRMMVSSSGVESFQISNPVATFTQTPAGEVMLTANASSTTLYSLTGYTE